MCVCVGAESGGCLSPGPSSPAQHDASPRAPAGRGCREPRASQEEEKEVVSQRPLAGALQHEPLHLAS